MNSEENRQDWESSHPNNQPSREEISREAYRLYERDGRQEGRDLEYWLMAEKALMSGGADTEAAESTAKEEPMSPMEFAESKEVHSGSGRQNPEQVRKNSATRQEIRQITSPFREAPRQSQRPQRRSA
jgi:hypothetical protein